MTSKIVAALLIGVVLFVSASLAVFYLKGSAGPEQPEGPEEPIGPEQPEGEVGVPWNVTWNVGDSWTSAIIGTEYTLTVTVVGEEEVLGIDCYVANLTFEPDTPFAFTGMHNDMQSWFSKSSLRTVQIKASGETWDDEWNRLWEWTYTEKYYYTVEGNQTDYKQTEEKNTYIYVIGVGPYDYWKNITKTWIKQEAIENVPVAAGEFSCFKMVVYDETGENILSTFWFSEEVKTIVKSENGEESELISYSIT